MSGNTTTSENNNEVKLIFSVLNTLITPPNKENRSENVQSSIENNYIRAVTICGEEIANKWITPVDLDYPDCKFVRLILSCLLRLQTIEENLYSVNDKTCVRSCVQFLNGLGIQPFLQPGIHKQREKSTLPADLQLQILSKIINYVLKLLGNKSWGLYSVILPVVLPEILPALIQLSWSPENVEYQETTKSFFNSVHQPTIIRELLLCMKADGKPLWYLKACSIYLTQCLTSDRGVISTVRALHDLSTSDETNFKTTAKLLSGPHGNKYYKKIWSQLYELLYSDNDKYSTAAVYTLQILYNKKEKLSTDLILTKLFQTLNINFSEELEGSLILEVEQENILQKTINILLKLGTMLPIKFITPCVHNICNLHLAIRKKGGTLELRNLVKDLLIKIMINCEDESVWKIIIALPEDCIMDLCDKNNLVANNLFTYLLQALTKATELEEKLLLCNLLSNVTELPSVQLDCLKNPNELFINIMKSIINDADKYEEMIPIVIILLGTIIAECEDFFKYQCFVPGLLKLRKSTKLSEGVRAVIEHIYYTIITYGVANGINNIKIPKFDKNKPVYKRTVKETKAKISEINPETVKETNKISEINPESAKETKAKISEINPESCQSKSNVTPGTYEDAMTDINDNEIAIKGHGFITLSKLINNKVEITKPNHRKIFDICLNGMKHEDSYVYLSALRCMSNLILQNLDTYLQPVIMEYVNIANGIDLRTRLGETLVQVCKQLGEMAGKYKRILMNSFLTGAKDESPAIRCSSLSNLGESCKILGFQVSCELQEILLCVETISSSDPDIEVRRASVLLLRLLLEGLGTDSITTLGSLSLDVQRALKRLALNEDSNISLHAQLALDQLKSNINDQLFAPKPLEKTIYITNFPLSK